jgi:hypothetical protein
MLLGARASSLNTTSGELKYSFDQAQHHLKYSEHLEFGINSNLTYTLIQFNSKVFYFGKCEYIHIAPLKHVIKFTRAAATKKTKK